MSVIAPERSLQQRMDALESANRIRLWRADLKRKLKAGEVLLVDVLYCDDARLESMKVLDLLLAVPGMGVGKAHSILRRSQVSTSKSVAGMTERQWDSLVSQLAGSTPKVRLNTLGY